jgi:hypothetical protein
MDDNQQKQTIMSIIKHNHQPQDSTGNMMLTASILFANIDYSGLGDYAIKAFVGGAIWMAFKVGAEYISERIKKSKWQALKKYC